MVVGDSPLTASPGLSQDSLDFEPTGSPEPRALASMEPPAHLGRLVASHKLEQVLERSRQLPASPAGAPPHHRSLKPPSKPQYDVPLFGAGEQEATEAETDLEAGLEEAEVVSATPPLRLGEECDGNGPFTRGWGGWGWVAGCGASLALSPWSSLGVGHSLLLIDGLFLPRPTPSCVEGGSTGPAWPCLAG